MTDLIAARQLRSVHIAIIMSHISAMTVQGLNDFDNNKK